MGGQERGATRRQWILGAVFLLIAIGTIVALLEVVWTVFFALTIAFILSPPRRWLRRRGIGRIPATAIVTAGAAVSVLVGAAAIAYLLFLEIDTLVRALNELPETIEISISEYSVTLILEDILEMGQNWLRGTALAASARIPEFLLKFGLFLFVVFGVVHREGDISENVSAIVPPRYRDISNALHRRALDTLVAIYVLQGVTAFATVVLAMPVFFVLGYDSWLTLAIVAGILQFVPVIGPSLLIAILVVAEILAGDILAAGLVLLFGGAIVAAAPDIVVRPQLARWTTELSSMLYFIGFVGGLLSLGAIGVIVGPLMVALLVEASRLVATSFDVK